MSPSGITCCLKSTGREKAPIKTRITIGTTVQATSTGVLWVKDAGSGLDLRLNLKITYPKRNVTNRLIAVIMIKSIPSSHCRSLANSVTAG